MKRRQEEQAKMNHSTSGIHPAESANADHGLWFAPVERKARRTWAFLIIATVLILGQGADAVGYEVNRNRSIYVPVLFASCEHLENVRLSVEGGQMVFPLGARIFQFAYYGDRKAILPNWVEVKIEAERVGDGGHFKANVFITPDKILSGSDSRTIKEEVVMKQLRVRRDVRLPKTRVLIKCDARYDRKRAVQSLHDGLSLPTLDSQR